MIVSHVAHARQARRLLYFALAISVVQLVPWIWINHDEAVALERFKTLPLGRGRTEVTVGHWYMRNNRPAEAEQWFRRGIEANPKNVNAHMLLGVLYALNGSFEPACAAFERAVELRPDLHENRQKYVAALLEEGRCKDAVEHLILLALHIPDQYAYWDRIGEELSRRRCTASLQEIYSPLFEAAERRSRSNPGDIQATLFSGISLMYCGRLEEAVERFRRSLDVDPKLAPALLNLGMILSQLGRVDEARPYLERFLSLYPRHPMAARVRQSLEP